MTGPMMTDAEVTAALDGARAVRNAAQARVQALPRPYLVDTFGGFQIECEPTGPGGRRLVEVVLDIGPVRASTYDTTLAGTHDVDQACLRREAGLDWDFIEGYLAGEGLALVATVDGRPATVELRIEGLGIRDAAPGALVGPTRAVISFVHGGVNALHTPRDGEPERIAATDWLDVKDWLDTRGITLDVETRNA